MDHIRPVKGPRPRPEVQRIARLPRLRREDEREPDARQDGGHDGQDRPDRRRRPDDGHIDVLA